MVVRAATPEDRPAVLGLYDACGYCGGLDPEDEILVAAADGMVVGAVRLCPGEALVLRGMMVHPDHRRRGIGGTLLHHAGRLIGGRTCWMLPHRHLVAFYGRIGFAVVDAAPPFVVARRSRYEAKGLDVVVLRRG